jgi:hypothetical protein
MAISLSTGDLQALREITKGPLRSVEIAPDILAKLKELGLVIERTRELLLTDAGEDALRQSRGAGLK